MKTTEKTANRPEVGSTVTLKFGGIVRQYVVLRYTKWHVDVASKENYDSSIKRYGIWQPLFYGYDCYLLQASGFRLGFFDMLVTD